MTFRIATWNIEWAKPATTRGKDVASVIESVAADVFVLTEGFRELLPNDGFVVDGGPDWGYENRDNRRRKVVMWSRRPWKCSRQSSTLSMSGRYVEGTTETPIGALRVIGVCIPWKDAHVRTGRCDRRPWEDHVSYLRDLRPIIEEDVSSLVVAGDYNQRIPHGRAPIEVFQILVDTFAGLEIPTSTFREDPLIDHVSHSKDISSFAPELIASIHGGKRLTDHRGVVVNLGGFG